MCILIPNSGVQEYSSQEYSNSEISEFWKYYISCVKSP